ncbi:bifunctional DNA primase/polymerase [Streptomyces vilmorinianum]|uniref:bifunctional DNA primase/polymerase n=1 Tax=Streptomyces vilmorinianum TaxID=3051092 RepID=UPI0010FACF1E|nr:bifunctional DNA primase/polymerase [Streptomyces vilmorinianum]
MSAWLRDETPLSPAQSDTDERRTDRADLFRFLRDRDEGRHHSAHVTAAGADWLASAAAYPRSTLALWEARPTAPAVLPCGTVFDVVNVDTIFGRRMLDRLWSEGPGTGPVAVHRGRMLLFASPGTAQRLSSLLHWVGDPPTKSGGEWGTPVPPPLCHGTGDAVTIPPLTPLEPAGPRWVVAPDTRHPWLPGPEVMLWACVRAVRAVRAASAADVRVSIFPPADQDAKVYDVSRRR